MTDQVASIASLVVEIEIHAPPGDVWKGLTQDIGQWWPAEFYTGGQAGSRTMEIELMPGGRMYESWKSGGGTLWANVVSFEPNRSLQVLGQLFPNWGGPSQWYGTWSLESAGESTKLTFSETTLGHVSKESTGEKESGWQFLSACLKAQVEGEPAPEWPE